MTPTFIVKVFKEGEKLMTQATGQPAFELFPEGENKFFLQGGRCESHVHQRRQRSGHRSDHSPGRTRYAWQEDQVEASVSSEDAIIGSEAQRIIFHLSFFISHVLNFSFVMT